MRRRRTACAIVAAAAALTGCATTVTGTGGGSGAAKAPTTAPASTPTRSSSPSGPTAFPSSTGASPSSDLERTKVDTAIGDPVTADLCGVQGLGFLDSLGYPTEFADERFPAGCTFRAVRNNVTQVGVTEFASPPGDIPARHGGHMTTVNGQRVYVLPQDSQSGECIRDVHADNVTLTVTGYTIEEARSSPKICKAADLGVQKLTLLLQSRTRFPSVSLASPSVYELDMCKLASAAKLTSTAPLLNSSMDTNNFGSECYLSNKTAYAYIDVARYIPAAMVASDRKSLVVKSHELLADAKNTSSQCDFTSRQGKTADGRGVEVIDFLVDARNYQHPPDNLCLLAASAFAKVLDAAGLH